MCSAALRVKVIVAVTMFVDGLKRRTSVCQLAIPLSDRQRPEGRTSRPRLVTATARRAADRGLVVEHGSVGRDLADTCDDFDFDATVCDLHVLLRQDGVELNVLAALQILRELGELLSVAAKTLINTERDRPSLDDAEFVR